MNMNRPYSPPLRSQGILSVEKRQSILRTKLKKSFAGENSHIKGNHRVARIRKTRGAPEEAGDLTGHEIIWVFIPRMMTWVPQD